MEPRDLARLSGVSRAAISGTVATLDKAGLVRKTREQPDRRLVTVRLTPAGTEVLESAYRVQNERERHIFDALSPEDLETFTRILRTLASESH